MSAKVRSQLARLSPENSAKVLATLKKRNQLIKKNADEMGERVAGMAVAGATSFFLGHWMGSKEVEYQKELTKHLDAGLSQEDAEKKVAEEGDPRAAFAGLPYDGVAAVGLGLIALVPSKMKRRASGAATYLEGAAYGALGQFLGRMGTEMAIESATKADDAE